MEGDRERERSVNMGMLASWWKNMIQRWKDFKDDNAGVGVVEIILILAVLIALVLIFKDQIEGIVTKAFKVITGDVSSVLS